MLAAGSDSTSLKASAASERSGFNSKACRKCTAAS